MAGEFQVGRKLRLVNGVDFFSCFDLHDDQAADREVHPKSGVDLVVSVSHRQSDLPLEGDISFFQFTGEALFVNGLQKSRAKRGVNSKRGINDLARNQIVLRRGFNHLGALALKLERDISTDQ